MTTSARMILTAAALAMTAVAAKAGCTNQFEPLDRAAATATEVYNGPAQRDTVEACRKLRRVVDAEATLLHYVEINQVVCVIDPEVVTVQRRRLAKARTLHRQTCMK